MNMQAREAYLVNQVNTMSKGELTLLLFNGCLKFIKQARACMENNDIEGRNHYLKKAQCIIDELNITLDMQYDISKQLRSLYLFIKDQLIGANIKNDRERLQVALELVTELRDTWVEAMKLAKTQKANG